MRCNNLAEKGSEEKKSNLEVKQMHYFFLISPIILLATLSFLHELTTPTKYQARFDKISIVREDITIILE